MKAEKNTVSTYPENAPDLGYTPVPDIFKLPPGMNFGPCSSVAVNSKGNILVFNRSAHALMEFDGRGRYLRSLANGVLDRKSTRLNSSHSRASRMPSSA